MIAAGPPPELQWSACTCRVTRPGVARCATNAKGSQLPPKPVSSFARRWITSARASTGRDRRNKPLPSASPRPVARALLLRRPSAAVPRMRHGRRRHAIGSWAAPVAGGQTPGAHRPLKTRWRASHVGRQRTQHYRHRLARPHIDALRLKDRRARGGLRGRKALRCGRQPHDGQPKRASRTHRGASARGNCPRRTQL